MAIETQCPNGHRTRVKDHLVGRTGRCPVCGTKFRIEPVSPLPLARLVPLDPAVVATLPRARPLASADRPVGPREAAGGRDASPPAAAADERPDPDRHEWIVVEADGPVVREPEHGVAEADLVSVEPVPEACGGTAAPRRTEFHAMIGETPGLTWCIAFPGGDPTEPLDAATMQAWLDGGHATGTEVVWRSDWPEWRPVKDVFPDFFAGGFRL